MTDVPEPVVKAVERILDEHSAWIARPNAEVTARIALQATLAAQMVLEQLRAFDEAALAKAVADEREACALVAEAHDGMPCRLDVIDPYNDGQIDASGSIAAAIRARSRRHP